MRKKQPNQSFEQLLREVKDNDEFVEHVTNIAARYRREHTLSTGPKANAVRQSLREFNKHAVALTKWLSQARKDSRATVEYQALIKIGATMYGVPSHAVAASDAAYAWLSQVVTASDALRLPVSKKAPAAGVALAAEGLRATFEHHKLKWSVVVTKNKQSAAIRLLCACAKRAGDASMTPELARQALLAVATK